LYVEGGYAYISTGEWGSGRVIHIVDVSDPLNPTDAARFDHDLAVAEDYWISGRYLYLRDYGNMYIFDVSDPVAPVEVTDALGKGLNLGAGWSIGQLVGEYVYSPSLDYFNVIDVPRDTEAMLGTITVDGNIEEVLWAAAVAQARASISGANFSEGSCLLNFLAISLLPVGMVFTLRRLHKK
jgi:hypothetical protein